jgi:zinc protease
MKKLGFCLTAFLATQIPLGAQSAIPSHPDELLYSPLIFETPDVSQYRRELENGIPVYIAPDRLLPLVTIRVYFRGGQYLEPVGKEGLTSLTGTVWRTGGAGELDARELDEELDFLAANLSTGIGASNGSVSLNLLSKDLDRGLELLLDVLFRPRFQEDRIDTAKDDMLAGIRRRNDSTTSIERREWARLIYGDDFWANRLSTSKSLDLISRDDLVQFHGRLAQPENFVLAAAGDFDTEAMMVKLNQAFGRMKRGEETLPEVPQPAHRARPGVYLVNKPDVNQGRVSIGHMGVKYPLEGEFSLRIASDVLGEQGLTSWIAKRVRSEEGLAYDAAGAHRIQYTYPGTFRAGFQSKSASCARAAKIVLELVEKLRSDGISQEELETSQNSFIQTFPNRFQNAMQTVSLFAIDDVLNRPHQYWQEYRQGIEAVALPDVKGSAQRHIHPDQFVILVVGNIEEILAGDPDYPDVKFENFGELVRLPLRDPLTLEPIEE